MVALLLLAAAGGLVRTFAPDPSTWRDVGTLLLVLWLPAVGNLVAYLLKKIPRRTAPARRFPSDRAFRPQLQVRLQWMQPGPELRPASEPAERLYTVLVGRSGFTARLGHAQGQPLEGPGSQDVAVEFLHPAVALRQLAPGTAFHLLHGTTAVAQGTVVP